LSIATLTSPVVFSPTLTGMTYLTAAERRLNIGRAIMALEADGRLGPQGSGPSGRPELINEQSGFGVGIWSMNRAEWQLVDLAGHAFSLVGVPLYDTLGPNVVEYVINHSPLSIVFASSNHIPALLKVAPKCKSLRVVVSMDNLMPKEGSVLKAWSESVGIELWELPDLEIWGAKEALKRNIQVRPPRPDQIATISYTSGTTGNPKGVLLNHSAVTKACIAQSFGAAIVPESEQPVVISYLPLAHM
jgi:long-chain acyl-CoA synthetase